MRKLAANKSKLLLFVLVSLALLVILIATFYLFDYGQFWERINQALRSPTEFQNWVRSSGLFAPLVYLLIQILQVIFAPIPGSLIGLAGGMMFGWFWGFVVSGIGMIIGSLIDFMLGRLYGQKLLKHFVAEDKIKRYEHLLHGSSFWVWFIIFLVPFFPDDLLCIVAGLTSLSWRKFILLLFIGRLPTVFSTNLAGAGILSLSNLELDWWIWLVLLGSILIFTLAYFLLRNWTRDRLQQRLLARKEKQNDDE